jgi:hypothetical protein
MAAAYVVAFATLVKEVGILVVLKTRSVRWSILIACLLTIHPNVYAFWAFFNYYNDGWGHLVSTQVRLQRPLKF